MTPPRPSPPSRHARGQVLVIALFALVLLASLVFYVLNLGRQANNRIVTQHSADAAAAAGAGWVARSLNTVAMNNVAISRYLALINTLDACPLVTKAALHEQTAMRTALNLRRNTFTLSSGLVNTFTHQEADILYDELTEEVATLTGVDQYFTNYDVGRMTQFNAPNGGRGAIWLAMESLDQFSQASMENLGTLAQLNADRGGTLNMTSANGDAAALLLPGTPNVPWKRGGFDDFERPVSRGRLPAAIDDATTNRGPFDTVFGWRSFFGQSGGVFGPGVEVSIPSPFGGGVVNPTPAGSVPFSPPVGYNTWGTQAWTLRLITRYISQHNRPNLNRSRFASWLVETANAKLGYLWPGTPRRFFAEPKWDLDYPDDLPSSPGEPLPFSETAYFRIEFKSRYPYGGGSFGAPGSIMLSRIDNSSFVPLIHSPDHISYIALVHRPGWWLPQHNGVYMQDPMDLNGTPGVTVYSAGALAWVYQREYSVMSDASIGIAQQFNSDGNPIAQPAYFVQLIIYAGVNRNLNRPTPLLDAPADPADLLVTTPYDGFDRTAADAPAPIDLDHALAGPTADARRQYLTFLGVARQSDRSLIWSSRFTTGQPYPNMVALAQAKVFNDHSWDLWTQMWHAQLEPVSQFDNWLTHLDQPAPATDATTAVSPTEWQELGQYLHSIQPLAPVMLNH